METTLAFIDFATCVYISIHSHAMYREMNTVLEKGFLFFYKGAHNTQVRITLLILLSFILCNSAVRIALKKFRHCRINYYTCFKKSEYIFSISLYVQ